MRAARNHPLEVSAFTALVALLLSPVLAQGAWLPMVHLAGPSGDAAHLTLAAVVIAATMAVGAGVHSTALAGALGAAVALTASIAASLEPAGAAALALVVAANTALQHGLPPRLPSALAGLATANRTVAALYLVLASGAVVSTARVSVFMGDPTRSDLQALPGEAFLETHCCLTAYVRAERLAMDGTPNLYDPVWWPGTQEPPTPETRAASAYRPFDLDYYAYPPPFLLVMTPLLPWTGDFPAQRALWFGLNGLLFAAALWIVADHIREPGAHRTLLLAPLLFGSLPILATLQVGNFQLATVAIAVLGMVALDRGRPVVGGALLGFAILSKLAPGVLGIVLLSQRRWRDAAWIAGFSGLLVVLSLLAHGPDPLVSFATWALPRIRSGEAFSFLDDDLFSIYTNTGPFGLPFKLQVLGLDVGDPWVAGRLLASLYTVALVGLAVAAGRRAGSPRDQAVAWMALLVMGALQGPFAPGYAGIALLWATTLLAADVRRWQGALGLVLLTLMLTVPPVSVPTLPMASYAVTQTLVAIGVPVWLILRPRGAGSEA